MVVPINQAVAWNDYGIKENTNKAGAFDQMNCSSLYTVNLTAKYNAYDDSACIKGEGTVAIGFTSASDIWGNNSVLIGRGFENGKDGVGGSIERSVVIGYSSGAYNWTGKDAGAVTLVGSESRAMGDQAVVVGNTSGAASQGVAIGGNVFARGESSIAIGNDDLVGSTDFATSIYADKLPEATLKSIFGSLYNADSSANNKTGWFFENEAAFNDKYNKTLKVSGADTPDTADDKYKDYRIFSPTFAAKQGAIAIGSRTIAGGIASTAVGPLAFALADRSTAIGIRSFVAGPSGVRGVNENGAVGATAMGENTRVYSPNSVAIGNQAETTADGTFSYGYRAKAVGGGSLAFGYATVAGADINAEQYKNLKASTSAIHNIKLINDDGTVNETARTSYLNGVNAIIQTVDAGFTDNAMFVKKGTDGLAPKDDGSNAFLETQDENGKTKRIYAIQLADGDLERSGTQWAENAMAIGRYSFALRNNTVAFGYATIADASSGIAIGSYSHVTDQAPNSVALGVNSYANARNSLVMGYSAVTHANNSLVLGMGATAGGSLTKAEGDELVAKKGYQVVTEDQAKNNQFDQRYPTLIRQTDGSYQYLARNSSAIGMLATATAFNSTALGNFSNANMNNSMALGYGSQTDYTVDDLNKPGWVASGAVAIPTSAATGVISVGAINQERRITNVASGYRDSDAVNVAQLRTLDERISNITGSENSSGLFQYMSIESKNGQAGQVAKAVNKTKDYNEYITLRKQYLGFVAREKYNGEQIDDTALGEIKKRLDALNNTYGIFDGKTFKSVSAKLSEIETALDAATIEVNKTKYKETVDSLNTAFTSDSSDATVASVLTAKETTAKALTENTNFKNDGAKGKDSLAVGWKATTGTRNADGTFNDAGAKGDHAIAAGFEATATGLNSIAMGSSDTVNGTNTLTKATGANSVAIGTAAQASGERSMVMGYNAKAFVVVD